MQTILFPTDFSETASNAFLYALNMSKSNDFEIIVLHTYEYPIVSYDDYPVYINEIYDAIEFNNFENFKDHIPYLRNLAEENGFHDVKMRHVLEQGDLIHAIKRLILSEKIDLIVMGTTGASGLKEIFLGSNANSIIEKIEITTLSIPSQAKYNKVGTILFTTQFKEKDKIALKQVLEVAKKMKSDVKCLHVETETGSNADINLKEWRDNFKNENVSFFVVPQNDVNEAIFDFIHLEGIDMMAMVTYKRSFLENLFHQSLNKKLSFHLDIPLLTLHQ